MFDIRNTNAAISFTQCNKMQLSYKVVKNIDISNTTLVPNARNIHLLQ